MSIEKMKADLSKLNDKIGQLQRKAKDMGGTDITGRKYGILKDYP